MTVTALKKPALKFPSIAQIIAQELGVQERQVTATMEMIADGATIPFIARYRKERTGGLDDTQLRNLAERLTYLEKLTERRTAILKAIDAQGKLSAPLEQQLYTASTLVELEDIYTPFKQKRRTKATIAKEAGLEPLADKLLINPNQPPEEMAKAFAAAK